MKTRLIIDEDSVYEIDEECDEARKEQEKKRDERRKVENLRNNRSRKFGMDLTRFS
ncbi:MAG: hypothetical protein HFI67_08205 [Lachnospiraceae bacterium]|jgi:hypothetical protein|nr:hypothetical protein [Lachnospiraceae bacterium]